MRCGGGHRRGQVERADAPLRRTGADGPPGAADAPTAPTGGCVDPDLLRGQRPHAVRVAGPHGLRCRGWSRATGRLLGLRAVIRRTVELSVGGGFRFRSAATAPTTVARARVVGTG